MYGGYSGVSEAVCFFLIVTLIWGHDNGDHWEWENVWVLDVIFHRAPFQYSEVKDDEKQAVAGRINLVLNLVFGS